MKTKNIFTYCALFALSFSSCNYLDIVPDEVIKEESTYQNETYARNYLYSCYGALPRRSDLNVRIDWRGRGMEYLVWEADFTNIVYSPSSPRQNAYTWGQIWDGIRLCYQFLNIIDKTPDITPENLHYYKAEAKFLIAYYHFVSLENYGPTCIMRQAYDQNTPNEQLPERSSYDEVVAFIDEKLTEVLPDLADSWTGSDYGRATKSAVWAIRSRMHLYAASPLFNGNKMYADFKSKIDDRNLISQTYDPAKWEKAAEVSREAIEHVTTLGHHLYSDAEAGHPDATKPSLSDMAQRRVRYCFMDDQNTQEILMADTRADGPYDIQARSLPRWTVKPPLATMNAISPTLQMVEKFYTKNGLPIDCDKTFDYNGRYSLVDMPVNYDNNNYSTKSNGKTMKLHLEREPRFYAWIGFHNGFAETAKYNNAIVNKDNAKKVIVLNLTKNGPQGRGNRTVHYSYTGYLNKKFVHPRNEGRPIRYPYPTFRMAELYLNYAEALIEWGHDLGDDQSKFNLAKQQLDIVRTRAGIPTVDDAWNNYSTKPGYQNTYEGLRDIVRTERSIEFYLEGNHFWDSRRWINEVQEELSPENPHKILNIDGVNEESFFKVMDSTFPMYFNKGQYLMPIATSEINKLPQLVQNPFYD